MFKPCSVVNKVWTHPSVPLNNVQGAGAHTWRATAISVLAHNQRNFVNNSSNWLLYSDCHYFPACQDWRWFRTSFLFIGSIFLGAFAKLRKATVSFVMYVHPSVRHSTRMQQIGSHSTDFHEIWYLRIFRKSIDKIQIPLKSDKNNGYFTRRHVYIYDNI